MATAMTWDIDGLDVKISSPDKIIFEPDALTKLQVLEYFRSVGAAVVAGMWQRPVTLERWPQGVREGYSLRSPKNRSGEAFYQKSLPKYAPEWVTTAQVTYPSGRTSEQLVIDSLASVLWAVQQGTLRFHPWPVRADNVDSVDELRLDLDPQPGTDFADAVPLALRLREILADAGLTSWVKTSGGRGVHVYAPVQPCSFIDARHAVIAVGRRLCREFPTQATISWWKEERGARIFVDFNQMARDRLMASPYSIRPVPAATVSMPVSWEQLPDVVPADFTVASVLAAGGDPQQAWSAMAAGPRGSIETLLEWYREDEAAGEGEMPYPPEYPKMPGEPPRVQPSRAKSHDADDVAPTD